MKFYLFLFLSISAYAAPKDSLNINLVKVPNGTGFVYKGKHKYIITNSHVCATWNSHTIVVDSHHSLFRASIVKDAPKEDLCALSAITSIPGLVIAKVFDFKERLYTEGFPNNKIMYSEGIIRDIISFSHILSKENLNHCPIGYEEGTLGLTCFIVHFNYLTSLFSQGGSSGSPIINYKNELVGVMESFDPNDARNGGIVMFKDLVEFVKGLQ